MLVKAADEKAAEEKAAAETAVAKKKLGWCFLLGRLLFRREKAAAEKKAAEKEAAEKEAAAKEAAEAIGAHGWRQGSVLGGDVAASISEEYDGAWLVVLSQDCDVVHRSFDVEPKVELVVFRPLLPDASGNPQLTHGKNPRRLQLSARDGRIVEADIRERFLIDRNRLSRSKPDPDRRIDDPGVRQLTRWVAKRYIRSAFPDAFNARWERNKKKIERALKKHGKHASGVFLRLNRWDELQQGSPYELTVVVVCPKAVADDDALEADVAELPGALLEAFGECDGIDVADAKLSSETEFTLHHVRLYKRWEVDFRSYSGRPGGLVAPEE